MSSLNLFSILFFISTTLADPEYLYHFCSDTNFTTNRPYQTNLNTLLSSLQSNTSLFLNTTTGQNPNRVYGLFLCRGDVSISTCQDCVTFATKEASQRCNFSKGYTVWYDQCLLRYSDTYFFSTVNTTPAVSLMNTATVSNTARFNQLLRGLMNLTASQAVVSTERFATREGKFGNETVYCLVQCTQDLSSGDCERCLPLNIMDLPYGKQGGRRLYPSCYSRYELYPFYGNLSTDESAPAPLLPPLSRHKGEYFSWFMLQLIIMDQ